jgi:hypothetical protein
MPLHYLNSSTGNDELFLKNQGIKVSYYPKFCCNIGFARVKDFNDIPDRKNISALY